MAKSGGGFLRVQTLIDKGYDPAGLPLLLPERPLSRQAQLLLGRHRQRSHILQPAAQCRL